MDQPPEIDSALLQAPRVERRGRTARRLLLAVVAAGIGCLLWFALQVPAITTELVNGLGGGLGDWLGRSSTAVDTPESRRSQVIFLLLIYSAPLTLGTVVYAANYLWAAVDRRRG